MSGEEEGNVTKKRVIFGVKLVWDLILFLWTLALEIVITILILAETQKQPADAEFGFNRGLFEWHPSLGAVGVIILMSNGLIAHHVLFFLPKLIARIYHGVVLLAWFCLGIASFAIIIRCKVEINDDHFSEVHERLGLVLVAVSLFQIVIGFMKFFVAFANYKVMSWHGRLGPFIYIIALATVCTGVQLFFEVDPAEYNIYYYPENYPNGVAPAPYYSGVNDLQRYSTTIYVLTAALGITVLFYEVLLNGFDIIPHKDPAAKKSVDEQDA